MRFETPMQMFKGLFRSTLEGGGLLSQVKLVFIVDLLLRGREDSGVNNVTMFVFER